jgi:hypothetical protein
MVDDLDDLDESTVDDQNKGGLSDSIRKALVTGMTALFMTEEGIRGALSEMKAPKEALTYLAQQTDKTRRDLFHAVSEEIKGYLKRIDLSGELRKALVGLKVEVKAELRFVEEGSPETKIEATIAEAEDAGPKEESARDKKRARTEH